jgi:hypothetical protein
MCFSGGIRCRKGAVFQQLGRRRARANGQLNLRHQLGAAERLEKEAYDAIGERVITDVVAVECGHENKGNAQAAVNHLFVQLKPVHPRHLNIRHDAIYATQVDGRKEIFGRLERFAREPIRSHQTANGNTHGSVVINNRYHSCTRPDA